MPQSGLRGTLEQIPSESDEMEIIAVVMQTIKDEFRLTCKEYTEYAEACEEERVQFQTGLNEAMSG